MAPSDNIIKIIKQIPEESRNRVAKVTLDMAVSMNKTVRKCFPKAVKVIDRFLVQKLAYDALQEIRIKHRWDAINEEPMLLKMQGPIIKNMFRNYWLTEIQENNYWP